MTASLKIKKEHTVKAMRTRTILKIGPKYKDQKSVLTKF